MIPFFCGSSENWLKPNTTITKFNVVKLVQIRDTLFIHLLGHVVNLTSYMGRMWLYCL